MKQWLLVLLFVPLLSQAQNNQQIFEKDSTGTYNVFYIHNFYNRTEDVVAQVALDFLKSRKDLSGEIVHDPANSCYVAPVSWTYKGSKRDCIVRAKVEADVNIYYKDNRTKIAFSHFKFLEVKGLCRSGAIEELEASQCCRTYQPILYKMGWKSYLFSGEYKKFLKRKSRDSSLF